MLCLRWQLVASDTLLVVGFFGRLSFIDWTSFRMPWKKAFVLLAAFALACGQHTVTHTFLSLKS